MHRRLTLSPVARGLIALGLAVGCTTDSPTGTGPRSPDFAKGGGGGGITVEATDPTDAIQDQTLDVRVLGTGFESTSAARFLLKGKATRKVVTNSVRFVSTTELVANITIAIDADIALYDVEVETPGPGRRRRGVGTELFAVTEKTNNGPPEPVNLSVTIPTNLSTGEVNMILPDTIADNIDPYDGGICGVKAQLDVETDFFDFRPVDNALRPGKKAERDARRACDDFPRGAWFNLTAAMVHLEHPTDSANHTLDVALDGYIEADPFVHGPDPWVPADDNLLTARISNLTTVPPGGMDLRGNGFNLRYCLDDGSGRPFRFNSATNPGSDSLEVARDATGNVFHVRTQAFPDNVGSCEHTRSDGTVIELLLHMDLAYSIGPLAQN